MGKGLSWAGGYTQNADGTISAKKSFLGSLTGSDSDRAFQAMQYNQALKQYNEQFQFQKDQFAFNKQMAEDTFAFNKDLSNRQQALAEESYYNGVSNQARQLASLGINPASQGQSLSGATMSGGSNISQPSANASGTSATSQSSSALGSAGFQGFLGILSSILQVGQLASSISYNNKMADVAEKNASANLQNADTNSRNADTSASVAKSTIALNNANVSLVNANVKNVQSKTVYQDMVNGDWEKAYEQMHSRGIYKGTVDTLRGLSASNSLVLFAITGLDKIISAQESGNDETAKRIQENINSTIERYNNADKDEKHAIEIYTEKMLKQSLGYDFTMDKNGNIIPKSFSFNDYK